MPKKSYEERKAAWADLHGLCDPLEKEIGVKPKLWMSEGLPSEQIGLAVRELGADILVMGTRGRRGLAGVLVGNTAEKVFHTTWRPSRGLPSSMPRWS